MTTMLLSKNLVRPSKVWARLEIAVPKAANTAWITPRIVLKMPWKTARIDPKAAVMVWKIPEMSEPRESTREGMIVICEE